MNGTIRPRDHEDLHPGLWLWFPPVILVAQYGIKLFSEEIFIKVMKSELGVVENMTVVMLIAACFVSIRMVLRFKGRLPLRGMGAFLILFGIGCFLFAGEEASWGQHWFHWDTPEAWAAFNPRGETSIHNASGLFDQLPRTVLTLAALVGGVVLPLAYRRANRANEPRAAWKYWLVPTMVCLPTAVLAMVVTWPKKVFEGLLDTEVPRVLAISPGETKEYLLALFLLLFVLSLSKRMRQFAEGR